MSTARSLKVPRLSILSNIVHSDSTRCGAERLANEYGAPPCN
jgi:hypothetical protein